MKIKSKKHNSHYDALSSLPPSLLMLFMSVISFSLENSPTNKIECLLPGCDVCVYVYICTLFICLLFIWFYSVYSILLCFNSKSNFPSAKSNQMCRKKRKMRRKEGKKNLLLFYFTFHSRSFSLCSCCSTFNEYDNKTTTAPSTKNNNNIHLKGGKKN